jgi:hypothetical protein
MEFYNEGRGMAQVLYRIVTDNGQGSAGVAAAQAT